MTYQALAFYTGLFASLHCVTMCGPLMLALQFERQSIWQTIAQKLIYQLGRLATYGLQGVLLGLIGSGFNLIGLQQSIAVITGALLLFAGFSHFFKRRARASKINTTLLNKISPLLGQTLSKPYGGLLAGVLNGILPCGISYLALAQAINQNTAAEAGIFMLIFGLGTLPLLIIFSLFPLAGRKIKTPALLVPTLFIVAGSMLVLRGFNLDIPYISHAAHATEAVCK